MRHLSSHRVAFVAVLGALVVSLVSASVANAAGLPLLMRTRTFAVTVSRCTDGLLTVVPSGTLSGGTYAQVTVSGISGSCASGRVVVYSAASPNGVLAVGTGTVAGSSMVVSTGAFVAPTSSGGRAFVMLDGWSVPATWTYTPPVGNVNKCEVRNANGTVDASTPCTLVGTPSYSFWGSAGSGLGNGGVNFKAPGIANEQYVAFTLTILGAPSGWSWSNAGLTSINNQGSAVTSSCSTLPTFSGQLPPNISAKPNLYVEFVENRTGTAGVICTVP